MPKLRVEISGLRQLMNKLSGITGGDALEAAMFKAQDLVKERMQQYPPPVSTYERTNELHDAWVAQPPKRSSRGLTGDVTNDATGPFGNHYAAYVQRDPSDDKEPVQAWMHEGLWQTDREVLDESAEEIAGIFGSGIEHAFNS